jgi:hypothetical protein
MNKGHSLFDFTRNLADMVPFISVVVGMIIKTGRDLMTKRKLSIAQRLGIYLVMIGGGYLGWWICMLLEYKLEDPRVPIIICVLTYLSEDMATYLAQNKQRILDWMLMKNIGSK